MAPLSPSESSSNSSRENSPDPLSLNRSCLQTSKPRPVQTSRFLKLPVDIFKCITDYLDRDAAWSLKKLCYGMWKSEVVAELLYKYPIQLNDVRDIKLSDWKHRSVGLEKWEGFQRSINDSNRKYVQKLAMSHWASIDDFKWVETELPALTSLDLSAIKDFVWSPEEMWTWKQLVEACPNLFARLEELEVSNWADYTAHSRIEYSYSYNDYKYKQKFRLSRRRDGGSVAEMIFPACKKLKILSIRERYSGFHTWNEWEVHQRVCCLVDGITKYCPSSMTKLRVHDYAPYRSLFTTDASTWSNLTDIEIGLHSWMEDRRDRDVIGPIPYRITQGSHHRDEEEAFDDKTFDTCERDHMVLGSHVVQGVGASFEDLLQSLRIITQKYPNLNIKPIGALRDITLHPFHLVNVNHRSRHPLGPNMGAQNQRDERADPVSAPEVQDAITWLSRTCDWRPILAWDSMMCDVFPANLEPSRFFPPKEDVVSRIRHMITILRSLGIPIRLSIGDRANTCPSSGLDGSLYFGDYKTFIGEEENKQEVIRPTQASFNLTGIAELVDELTIQYPIDMPSISSFLRSSKRPKAAEQALLDREMTGWRRFWARYACQFKNLKKLTANVPNGIYNDWGKCEGFRELLSDKRWEMLEVEDTSDDLGSWGPYGLLSLRLGPLGRKRRASRFVQRVFFRQDGEPLTLTDVRPGLSEQEREENEIPDAEIADKEYTTHRFWPPKPPKKGKKERGEKRKHTDEGAERDMDRSKFEDDEADADEPSRKKRKDESLSAQRRRVEEVLEDIREILS